LLTLLFPPQTFGAEQASQYMNPYIQQALQPQLQELQRQQEIKRVANASRMTQAGAYGGGRQAIMESELDRTGLEQSARITGNAYLDAYNKAQAQFNTEQDRQSQAQELANRYGLAALGRQADLGATQQSITGQGIAADRAQFEEERAYPYKQIQYQQGLLQGLPLTAQTYNYTQPTAFEKYMSTMTGIDTIGDRLSGSLGGSETGGVMGAWEQIKKLFGGGDSSSGYSDDPTGQYFDALGNIVNTKPEGAGPLDYVASSDLDELWDTDTAEDAAYAGYYGSPAIPTTIAV
jgi:hypothetical protein